MSLKNILRILFWIPFLLYVSCIVRVVKEYDSIHPDFTKYVTEFVEITGADIEGITIGYGKTYGEKIIGQANVITNEITIDRAYWNYSSDLDRKLLIWHELLHLKGYMKHDERVYEFDGCPVSIMYPSTFSLSCYYKYEKEYIEDMKMKVQ